MRYWALVMALCLALAGCSRKDTQSVRIDPALSTLIPAGTNMLAGMRMEAIQATPLYKKWFAQRPLPGLDELARDTGIDPRKDLWEVLIAAGPAGSVAMARGKFSEQGLEPKLQREGAKRTGYKGYTLIGDDEGAVTFMNPGTAVAGRPDMVRAVIDQRNSPNRAAGQALLEKAKAIPRDTQIWMVSTGGFGTRELPKTGNMANLGKLASMVDGTTAAVNLGTGIHADVNAQCRTDQDAKGLHDSLRGLIGMLRLMTPENQRDMLKVYDAIQVEQKERAVRVTADLPEQVVDTLAGKFAASRGAGAGAR